MIILIFYDTLFFCNREGKAKNNQLTSPMLEWVGNRFDPIVFFAVVVFVFVYV
jgi:hypothetical protein